MPTAAKRNKERRSAAISLFFHYKYFVLCVLLLCIFGVLIAPRSTIFEPLPLDRALINGVQQRFYTTTDTLAPASVRLQQTSCSESASQNKIVHKPIIKSFNPDTASAATWQHLGFTEKQAASIIRYRSKIGGFRYKERLADCYIVGEKRYKQLEPYIALPNQPREEKKDKTGSVPQALFYFNPDTAGTTTFQALGFSERQARAILRFRSSLGGKFGTPEQFGKSYVVDSGMLNLLRPYMVFE